MKSAITMALLLLSTGAFAVTESECKQHVADHIGTLSICYNSGITDYNGQKIVNFTVNSCSQPVENADWVCSVTQTPWPSSGCEMEIVLDSECYYNKSARITKEGREDM